MGESRNAYRVLVARPEGKTLLERSRRKWEDNVTTDLRKVGYDAKDWIILAQNRGGLISIGKSGRRKNDDETDQEEKKKLAGSLAEKNLHTEGCIGRNGEREKKISDDRRRQTIGKLGESWLSSERPALKQNTMNE
ncbi:hypothetical protein ANN_19420 [Periplaneta americana]|uniref:Uncharacterized protein n=1 Tax=Periplaneta americana TaxID=6978 RepID=A0ABQ8S9U5_PERAM|nr:hypothetical protein ANN_19420 [Periplaneta americana]